MTADRIPDWMDGPDPEELPPELSELLGVDGSGIQELLGQLPSNKVRCANCQKQAQSKLEQLAKSKNLDPSRLLFSALEQIFDLPHIDHLDWADQIIIKATERGLSELDIERILRTAYRSHLDNDGEIGKGLECPIVQQLPLEEPVVVGEFPVQVEEATDVVEKYLDDDEDENDDDEPMSITPTQTIDDPPPKVFVERAEVHRMVKHEGCSRLDLQQRQVENIKNGPIMVVAGPGSGKTAVIACRFVQLVEKHGVNPHRILTLSFSNGVVNEIIDRLESSATLNPEFERVRRNSKFWIRTFHGAGTKMIGHFCENLGFTSDFGIAYERKAADIYNQCITQGNYNKEDFPLVNTDDISKDQVYRYIADAKSNLVTPEEFSNWLQEYNDEFSPTYAGRFAELYADYNKKLKRNDMVDFEDQIYLVVKLLERNSKTLLPKVQNWFSHIIVDAYQDMSMAQWRLVEMLSRRHHNLMMVGDLDQHIYSFRGASRDYINEFFQKYQPNGKPEFPEITVEKLEICYRSTEAIVDAGVAVINKNQREEPKMLASARQLGFPILLTNAETSTKEAEGVTRIIMFLHEKSFRFGDIAVLYRTNAQDGIFKRLFQDYGIPYEVVNAQELRRRRDDGVGFVDKVSLLTMHRSKGLEFPIVFMVGLEEGLIPHSRSMDFNGIEDERRLFYVAMTRARDLLFLTWAKQRDGEEQQRSLFIGEIPENLLHEIDQEWDDEEGPFRGLGEIYPVDDPDDSDDGDEGEDGDETDYRSGAYDGGDEDAFDVGGTAEPTTEGDDWEYEDTDDDDEEEPFVHRVEPDEPFPTPPQQADADISPKPLGRDGYLQASDMEIGMRVEHEMFGAGTIQSLNLEEEVVSVLFDGRNANTLMLIQFSKLKSLYEEE